MAGSGRIPVIVETYSGYKADERPVGFRLEGRRIGVREILDRWHGVDHAYFKVIGEDGTLYIMRQDLLSDTWELILMEVPTPPRTQGGT